MSRERKIYTAVLMLVGAGLAIDRGFFGLSGPNAVHAASPAALNPQEPRRTPVTASAPSLAERMKQLPVVPRDIDLLAATLRPKQIPHAVQEVGVQVPTVDLREEFAAAHQLTAIASNTRGSNALINGRAVSVGEMLNGYTLIEVTRSGAKFSGPGGEVELRLPQSR